MQDTKQTDTPADIETEKKKKTKVKKNKAEIKKDEEEEEIPQLVPIETPIKKPKLEVSAAQRC